MIIDTVSFLLITHISLCSFIGFGILTSSILFKEKIIGNIFNHFFLGLVFIIPISLIYHIVIGNNELVNIFILLIGYFLISKCEKKEEDKKVAETYDSDEE